MTMMITKFHKLIQSKILWFFFLGIIVITFVFWGVGDTATPRDKRSMLAGELNGESITRNEFFTARAFTQLAYALRGSRNESPDIDQETWQRIATIREALKAGIIITDNEIQNAITQQSWFQAEGKYDHALYQNFLFNLQQSRGIGPKEFEVFIHQELTIQRLQNLIYNGYLVPPAETKQFYQSLKDRFEVEYIVLTAEQIADRVLVSEEEIKAFYDQNPAAFTLPPEVRVKYVALPLEEFDGGESVTDEEVQAVYDANPQQWLREVEVPAAFSITGMVASVTNAPEMVTINTNLTVAEVRDEIVTQLSRSRARRQALDKGTEISIALSPSRYKAAPEFETVVAEFKVQAHTSEYFRAQQPLPGIDPAAGFSEAAFGLSLEASERVTDSLPGSNAVYVIYLDDQRPARVPAYEEIKDRVTGLARNFYLNQALTTKSRELRDTLSGAVSGGQSFSNAVAGTDFPLQVLTSPPFTRSGGEWTAGPFARTITGSIGDYNQGEVTQVLPDAGGQIIAHVKSRTEADWTDFKTTSPLIANSIQQGRGALLIDQYGKYLLEQGRFDNYLSSGDDATKEAEEDAPEEEQAS